MLANTEFKDLGNSYNSFLDIDSILVKEKVGRYHLPVINIISIYKVESK